MAASASASVDSGEVCGTSPTVDDDGRKPHPQETKESSDDGGGAAPRTQSPCRQESSPASSIDLRGSSSVVDEAPACESDGDGDAGRHRWCPRLSFWCTPSDKEDPTLHTHTPGEAGVVAENGLAARVECSLGPGVLGGEMALANDDRGLRVLVDKASTKARASGVAVGDVLLSLDQSSATARELQFQLGTRRNSMS